jgi:hypothetical protein
MARLPIPGSDNQQWGNILNDYLGVAHTAGGTIKNGVIGNDQITDVSQTKVTGLSATLSNKANNSDVVHLTGDESISGVKTFSGTIDVPTPTTDTNAATKLYVDSLIPDSLVYNIRDYGAVGDGTTDDQAAIQAAIDAAQTAGGGIVFVPQGTYIVSGTPQITGSNILVTGTGTGSKILLASAALNASGVTLGLWVNGGSNVIIRNIMVDGNFANVAKNGSYHGASALWSPIISEYGAEGPKTYQYAGSGIDAATYLQYRAPIRISNANNVLVEGCWITNSISAGILIDGSSVDSCTDIMVRNCRLWLIWDNAIYFHMGVRRGSAVANHCTDTQYSGVASIYCNDILTANNVCRNNGPSASDSSGIEYCGVNRGAILGNIIDHAQFAGIELKSTEETNITNGLGGLSARNTNLEVANNLITNCKSPNFPTNITKGIDIFGSDDTLITGNKVHSCDYGIAVGSLCVGATVSNNVVRFSTSVGVEVGNSADVIDVVVSNNVIERNGADGITGYAPAIYKNNIIRRNSGQGITLADPPTGLTYKVDIIEQNVLADNLYNGIGATASRGNLAVIRNNNFINSDTLSFLDGVITASSLTFTSASANFIAADTGTAITILGALNADGTGTLNTVITSVVNGTTVTLGSAPAVSRSGVSFNVTRGRSVFFDGVLSTGSNILESATANFRSGDVGKAITVFDSSGPNPRMLYRGTIANVVDATHADIGAAPANATNLMFALQRGIGIQERAVWMDGSSDVHFTDNRIWGMRTDTINATSFTNNGMIKRNEELGSVNPVYDVMSGTATIGAASTTVVVTHLLGREPWPGNISVTPNSSLATATTFWVSNVNVNNFTINVNAAPGSDITFAWRALLA